MPSAGRVRYIEALPPPASAAIRRRGALILLHAFPLNARMWEPQLGLAGGGWHVIAPQVRGVDGALDTQPVTSIDDYVADLIDLLDALHIEDAVFCGLSMGGYLAFSLLKRAPSYIRGLVLADTRPQADTPEGLEGRERMLALVRKKGPAAVADEMIPKLLGETTRASRPAVVERVRALTLANSAEAIAGAIHALMSRPDSTPLLAGIHVPTLVVVGEEDTVTPPALSEEMHAKIAGSELVRIPHAGHLSNIERPDAFNAALTTFLDHRV
jgi:pimeloyl-ACP methyl ester carboxylesterase